MNKDRTGKTFLDRPPNEVHSIIEDKTGRFWFGTRDNTFVYDGKIFTTFTNKDGKAFESVWGIIEDEKGNIWLGGHVDGNDGLWRYDGSTFSNFTHRGVLSIIEDKKGNIWTTGAEKLNGVWALSRYDAKSLSNTNPTVTEIKSGEAFFGILEANDGSIWFGSWNGVYRYDGKTITDFKSAAGQK